MGVLSIWVRRAARQVATLTTLALVTALSVSTAGAAPAQATAPPGLASQVNAAAAGAPMRMKVGSDNPLLLTQLNIGNDLGHTDGFTRNFNSGWSMAQLWASVPDDLKHNIGFVLHQGHTALSDNNDALSQTWLEDNVAEASQLGIPVFILWDEGTTLRSNAGRWTFLEHLYQTYPGFMGTVVSEQTDTLSDLTTALKYAQTYGGFHVLGSLEEGNLLANFLETPANWDAVSGYAQNFIFNPKNFHENFETVNAWTQGAWLAGAFDNWGPYFDGYPYYGCGYFGANPTTYSNCGDRWSRSIAETVASSMMLDQWQNGATVFHLENQLDVPTTGNLYSPYFYQSILPAMRYILSHPTPTRADVTARTKVAFSESEGSISTLADSTAPWRSANPKRTTFFSMYEKTPALTAINKQAWFYLRSSGRYNIVPRIPKLAPKALLDRLTANGATVLTKSTYDPKLQYGDARDALFNTAYPAISEGSAFVQNSGDSWLVYNTNDRDNVAEDATVHLAGKTFTQLQLPEVTPHTWAMATEHGSSMSVLLDTYATDRQADLLSVGGVRDMEFNRDFVKYAYVPHPQDATLRTTTMSFDVTSRPTATIQGYDANTYSYTEQWDPNTHRYTIVVQSNGVVDITLTTQDGEAGWTSVDPSTSDQVASATGATELAFDGSSVAWVAPAGATGSASASIDGVVVDATVDLSGGGTVFRATGLTNSVHVLRLEGASLPVSEFRYVPSVEHAATAIESNDFQYGSAADDEDTAYGSDGWRVIDGHLKLVGFVFPFYGDTTVYNTNVKPTNVRYETTMTLVNGTSGSIMVRGDEKSKLGYFFRIDPSRTAEGRTGTAGYSCSLHQNSATGLNTWGALATCDASLTLAADTPYHVVLTADGGTITASIDGVTVLTYTGATVRAGYTGVRAAQAQSDVDGAKHLGQFVTLDDVTLTDLDTSTVVYTSGFDDWAQASGWMTETALVFGANTKPDPRSSFTFPYAWTTSGADVWSAVRTAAYTSGFSGYYTAGASAGSDLVSYGGAESAWAADGGYDYWSWLRVTSGDRAGLAFRVTDDKNMYQARLDVATGTVQVGTVVGGAWTELASAASPVPLSASSWQLLKVSARGPLITVMVGGSVALTVRDDTFRTGAAGLWVPSGGVADVDDARVVARPAQPFTAARGTSTVVASDGIAGRHVTGFDQLAVRTARTVQPVLPATVTARYSDGTTAPLAVTWPAITADQLAVSTNPTATGLSHGRFTVQGTVTGTTLPVPVAVTVMPNITATSFPAITGTYDPAAPTVPTQNPGTATLSDGAGGTWTSYLYVRWQGTPTTTVGSPTTQTITGIVNGSPWLTLPATMTVAVATAVPGAPTAVTATAGNGDAAVTWTAPASDGGAAITGYVVTSSPAGKTCTTAGETTCTVTGLDNGTAYTFTVVATNVNGGSAASEPSAPVTPVRPPAAVPVAPGGATAVGGDARASVSWVAALTAPGDPAVDGYVVTAEPGGATCTTTDATTCDVTGLVNGTEYRFTVTAHNTVGWSASSSATAWVTPSATATVPSAPQGVSAVPGSGQATVRWTAPVSDGGAAIVSSTVTSDPGGATCTTTGVTCVVRGLTNGTAYTFTVTARNAVGSSVVSAASAAVTPSAANLALNGPTTSYYTYGGSSATNNANRVASKMVDGIAGQVNGADAGYFTGGNSEGALLGYSSTTFGGDLCSWVYVDLGADREVGSYAIMFGQNSTSNGNKMFDSPYQLQVLSTAAADASTVALRNSSTCAVRTFTAGKGTGNFNGAAYHLDDPATDVWTTVDGGTGTLTLDRHALKVPTTARYVRVRLDEVGTAQVYGTAVFELQVFGSDAATAPGAPTAVMATAHDGAATVGWSAPASDGGSPVTGYTVTSSPGGLTCTTTGATTCDVTGLTNLTPYTFTVTATSAVGDSVASEHSTAVRPVPAGVTVPSAPRSGLAVAWNGRAIVTWRAPVSNGGLPITGYVVTASPGGRTCVSDGWWVCEVTGLTNGTTYTFTVVAHNLLGDSPASAPSRAVTPRGPVIPCWLWNRPGCSAGF